MSGSFLQLRHINKSFSSPAGEFHALKSVNLDFSEREYAGIVGRSGSGKSTLLNLIAGIDHPTSGEITIGGKTLASMDETELSAWRGKNIGTAKLALTISTREALAYE